MPFFHSEFVETRQNVIFKFLIQLMYKTQCTRSRRAVKAPVLNISIKPIKPKFKFMNTVWHLLAYAASSQLLLLYVCILTWGREY